jgi:hypothetical protein
VDARHVAGRAAHPEMTEVVGAGVELFELGDEGLKGGGSGVTGVAHVG